MPPEPIDGVLGIEQPANGGFPPRRLVRQRLGDREDEVRDTGAEHLGHELVPLRTPRRREGKRRGLPHVAGRILEQRHQRLDELRILETRREPSRRRADHGVGIACGRPEHVGRSLRPRVSERFERADPPRTGAARCCLHQSLSCLLVTVFGEHRVAAHAGPRPDRGKRARTRLVAAVAEHIERRDALVEQGRLTAEGGENAARHDCQQMDVSARMIAGPTLIRGDRTGHPAAGRQCADNQHDRRVIVGERGERRLACGHSVVSSSRFEGDPSGRQGWVRLGFGHRGPRC